MSGEWPADPKDPRCPHCEEPVSATASYCMHCEADLPSAGACASATTTSDTADHADPLVDPDSLLDNVSTVAVGLVAGVVDVVLLGLVAFWGLPGSVEGAAVWIGLLGGAGLGIWTAYSPTVFDAARKAGYAIGGLLALVPPTLAFALTWTGGDGPIGGMIVFGVFLWPVALGVAAVGWVLGLGGVDDGEV